MDWIKSNKRKPSLEMETVVEYGTGKKEIVLWTAELIANVAKSKVEFSWFEIPTKKAQKHL